MVVSTLAGPDGQLPMHWAAWRNTSLEVVRHVLLTGGAQQLAVPDEHGRLPLHRAAACNPNLAVTPLGPENSRAVWLGFSRNSSFHLPIT